MEKELVLRHCSHCNNPYRTNPECDQQWCCELCADALGATEHSWSKRDRHPSDDELHYINTGKRSRE